MRLSSQTSIALAFLIPYACGSLLYEHGMPEVSKTLKISPSLCIP
jgi:hypothetical protein